METAPESVRSDIATMTDRELLEEAVTVLRMIGDVVADMSKSPMVSAMMNGNSPLMGMFKR